MCVYAIFIAIVEVIQSKSKGGRRGIEAQVMIMMQEFGTGVFSGIGIAAKVLHHQT